MSSLSAPYLHDEAAAHEFVESVLWPTGPVCPHCGCTGRITKVKANPEKRIRVGLWRCGDCKKQFTVKVGTVFKDSKIKLHLWVQAVVLMTASKKGISAHQLHRTLGVTYKTAWSMEHRIREAMRSGDLAPFGAYGGIVEVEKTFIGDDRTIKPKHTKKGRGFRHKHKVLSLVDRATGRARSIVVDDLKAPTGADPAREHRQGGDGDDGRSVLLRQAGGLRRPRVGAPRRGRIWPWRNPYEHDRRLLLDLQARHEGRLSALQQAPPAPHVAEFEFRYNNRSALGIEDAERTKVAVAGAVGKCADPVARR